MKILAGATGLRPVFKAFLWGSWVKVRYAERVGKPGNRRSTAFPHL